MWTLPVPETPDPQAEGLFRAWFTGLLRHSGRSLLCFVAGVLALPLDTWLPFLASKYWPSFVLACAAAPPARFLWNHRGRTGAASVSRGERAYRYWLACLAVGGVPVYLWWCLDMIPLAARARDLAETALFLGWGLWLAGPGARRMTDWILSAQGPE